MSSGQNGKGDRARNNWGHDWYDGYDAINWHRKEPEPEPSSPADQAPAPARKPTAPESDQSSFPGE